MERINLEGAENFIGKSYLEIGEEVSFYLILILSYLIQGKIFSRKY